VIDHEAADALLAGYVLGSLTGDDAAEADRLLTEHVPDCDDCRATLDSFQGLTGEIGLSAAPVAPPDTLLPRLRRSLDGGRRGLPAWSPTRLVAAAAAAVVVVGAAGLAIAQRDRAPAPQQSLSRADIADVQELRDGSDPILVNDYMKELVAPEELLVWGRNVPAPPPGSTYRLWTVDAEGEETWAGDFAPVNGEFVVRVTVDPTTVEDLLVTVEPMGSEPSEPGATPVAAAA
jgi:anti-sigma-K factor RskA